MYLVVRAAGDPVTLVPAIRAAVAELDPNVPLREVRTMEQLLQEAVAAPRFRTLLLGAFAGIALLLAAAGIYGVMSYTVDQRRREISVRLALGARPGEIVGLVVRRGMLLAGTGVLLGLAGAAALSTLLQTLLFEIGAIDVRTYAAAAAFLALIALVACCIPALRAAGVDAAGALRSG
jgi:putative ABC transport system permease protein